MFCALDLSGYLVLVFLGLAGLRLIMFGDFTLFFGIWIRFLCGCLADARAVLLFPKFEVVSSTFLLEFFVRSPLMKLSCDFIVWKPRIAAFGL